MNTEDRCQSCGLPRESAEGYTCTRCGVCAAMHRNKERNKHRAKVGIPLDAPIGPGKRGPQRPKGPPKQYGTLTLEDIRKATSALPLKPPGK